LEYGPMRTMNVLDPLDPCSKTIWCFMKFFHFPKLLSKISKDVKFTLNLVVSESLRQLKTSKSSKYFLSIPTNLTIPNLISFRNINTFYQWIQFCVPNSFSKSKEILRIGINTSLWKYLNNVNFFSVREFTKLFILQNRESSILSMPRSCIGIKLFLRCRKIMVFYFDNWNGLFSNKVSVNFFSHFNCCQPRVLQIFLKLGLEIDFFEM
jgi:hypothetical protein